MWGHRDIDTRNQYFRRPDNLVLLPRFVDCHPENKGTGECIHLLLASSILEIFSIPGRNDPILSSIWFDPTIERRHGTGDNRHSYLHTILCSVSHTPWSRVLGEDRPPNRRNPDIRIGYVLSWLLAIVLCDSLQSTICPMFPGPKAAASQQVIHQNVPRHQQSHTVSNSIIRAVCFI